MSNTKVITGKVRFSYCHIFTPKAMGDEDPKYSISILIPKKDKKTLNDIKKAIDAAKAEGKSSKFGGKIPAKLKLPLRDGDVDKPEDPAYVGHMFVNATSKRRPGIVDKDMNEILDPEDLVSGDYGRVSINFYPFAVTGNKGVAAGLNNVQLLAKGEPLSGGSTAEEDFAKPFEEEDADENFDDLL